MLKKISLILMIRSIFYFYLLNKHKIINYIYYKKLEKPQITYTLSKNKKII